MKYINLMIGLLLSANISLADIDFAQITDNFIDQHIQINKTPGLIMAVVNKGKIVHFRTFGKRDIERDLPVEQNTLFRIGSLTKTFTASAIMVLRDRGILKLDDPIENYIEEFKSFKYPYPNTPLITIRHLVTHTSSLIRHPQPPRLSIEALIEETINPTLGPNYSCF